MILIELPIIFDQLNILSTSIIVYRTGYSLVVIFFYDLCSCLIFTNSAIIKLFYFKHTKSIILKVTIDKVKKTIFLRSEIYIKYNSFNQFVLLKNHRVVLNGRCSQKNYHCVWNNDSRWPTTPTKWASSIAPRQYLVWKQGVVTFYLLCLVDWQ